MRDGYPLVELHRHLDGNLRLATILSLAAARGIPLPARTPEGLRAHVQVVETVPDLVAFLAKFDVLQSVLADVDAVRRVAVENIEDAAAEGIDHVELRFSPAFMAMRYGLDVRRVAETVCSAVAEATARFGVSCRLIVILSRNLDPKLVDQELEAAVALRDSGITAMDLAGNERDFPGSLFVRHFRRARDAGLRVIAHAGEAAGAESVWQAVRDLGAERIGHGVAARTDEALMDHLADRRIALEMCPTSNVQTSTVASFADHPLPMFLRRGMAVCLNTDDPSICGVTLPDEFRIAENHLGLSRAELRLCQEHALAAAFLTDEERARLLRSQGVGSRA